MKSYYDVKAKMEASKQQMVEAKKSKSANVLREVTGPYKQFCFIAGIFKELLAKRQCEK